MKQKRMKGTVGEIKGKGKEFGIRDISEMDVSRITKLSGLWMLLKSCDMRAGKTRHFLQSEGIKSDCSGGTKM